jgi:protein-S-isoprenylcysteine O-methyltransferase Ste14
MMRVSQLQLLAWIELLLCWLLWCLAFVKPSRQAKGQKKAVRASSSRWGIGLVTLGFAMVWMWVKPFGFEKSVAELVVSMVLAPPSAVLAWSAARELGKQWRYEAALSADHELIQTGPYRFIRHPIYTSMFGMLMATGAAYTWWPMWVAGTMFSDSCEGGRPLACRLLPAKIRIVPGACSRIHSLHPLVQRLLFAVEDRKSSYFSPNIGEKS